MEGHHEDPLLSELLPTSTPLEEEEVSARALETGDKGQKAGEQLAERPKNASEGEPAVVAPTQQQAPAAQRPKKKKRRQTRLTNAGTFEVGTGKASSPSSVRQQTKSRQFGSLSQT